MEGGLALGLVVEVGGQLALGDTTLRSSQGLSGTRLDQNLQHTHTQPPISQSANQAPPHKVEREETVS